MIFYIISLTQYIRIGPEENGTYNYNFAFILQHSLLTYMNEKLKILINLPILSVTI